MRLGFQRLNDWYSSAEVRQLDANPQAQYPFQRSFFLNQNGARVDLIYKRILIDGLRKPVFLAQRKDNGHEVVVKFVVKYGLEVHEALAACGMAPAIYGHEAVARMTMVVMEHIEGRMWQVNPNPSNQQKVNLRAIESKLREGGFVHGDLRPPNIMVQGDRVFLIDFDWAGQAGTAKYPIHLNANEMWHPNASVGCLIDPEHDTFMVNRLCSP